MSTDAELIRRSDDDPEVFSLLFERHAVAVHRYIDRRAGADVAEEVMAETFLTAFEQRSRFDRAVPDARPWLLGIATNLLKSYRRREARHLRVLAKSAQPEDHDGGIAQVLDRSDAERGVRQIAAALRGLTDGDRDVLLLHAWGDLDAQQIAATLGIPVGTVRSRLFRARRILRASLTDRKEPDHGRADTAATA